MPQLKIGAMLGENGLLQRDRIRVGRRQRFMPAAGRLVMKSGKRRNVRQRNSKSTLW
jgi:hypothetical protein